MAADGSITRCIHDLGGGRRREDAARELWDRFFADLARHALRKLRDLRVARGPADEEDTAARAFAKVCRALEAGRLHLASRIDLRKLLLAATTREARRLARRDRGGEDLLPSHLADDRLPPDLIVLAEEGCRRLLDLLGEEDLRGIARWKLAGLSNEEIGARLGCSLAKVERKLGRIRRKWAAVAPGRPAVPGPRGPAAAAPAADIGDTTALLQDLRRPPPSRCGPSPAPAADEAGAVPRG